ncbi:hypothetical protein Terro_0625 [Terriglobus roseus DSM 18391]|uniref:Uncharacterized protein n=1 Tax=Terriglobus roseus (strain DSM 18391 / NRRL B-41598 / KBS 63) TaxID=926566 RepID=I3ZCJ6_TERRK|nr:hypothetical protein [Terriglobus roseus]AFL86964.1 hypothetical protein Terro_0625 [Terriglobus roseus DSM 18391]
MLEVHPPHKPIHGTGEFFLHLFTITIGLLIAVGIEAGVERWHHHELAESARASMNAEIRRNATKVNDAVANIEKEQDVMRRNSDAIAVVQSDPKGKHDLNLEATYNITGLDKTAWLTAGATSALSYMPYEDAKKLSGIYKDMDVFERRQETIAVDSSRFFGLIGRYQIGKRDVSQEAADSLAEICGVWQGDLVQLHIAAKVLQEEQNAYLQGREPFQNLSEKYGK